MILVPELLGLTETFLAPLMFESSPKGFCELLDKELW